MPIIYVHLSGHDIDDAILKANGIVQNGASIPNVLKETESPKLDISSLRQKLANVEAKITELLGS